MTQPLKLHLGSEIEYFAGHNVVPHAIREYYQGQYEVNNFHVSSTDLGKNLKKLYKWADILPPLTVTHPIAFSANCQGSGGPVFAGVHIHLQVRGEGRRDQGHTIAKKREFADRLGKVVMADIIRYFGMTFRCMTSHHLHGAHRQSQYNYKQKIKYAPVIWHEQFDTYELRCIEPQMLYTDSGKAALKSIISRAYDYLSGREVRIATKFADLVHALRCLPGDLTHNTHALKYKQFAERLVQEGVPIHFNMPRTDSNAFQIRYDEVSAKRGEIVIGELEYGVGNLHSGDTPPQVKRGVSRIDGESVTEFNVRSERVALREHERRLRAGAGAILPTPPYVPLNDHDLQRYSNRVDRARLEETPSDLAATVGRARTRSRRGSMLASPVNATEWASLNIPRPVRSN